MTELIAWAAKRARSILATSPSVYVGVVNEVWELSRHAVGPTGDLLFAAPAEADQHFAAVGCRLPAPDRDATVVDVSGVPQPDRVRGTVRLRGPVGLAEPTPQLAQFLRVSSETPVLRLTPRRVSLDWRVQTIIEPLEHRIPVSAYADAPLDPLAGWEAGWTAHLDQQHPSLVADLARRLDPELPPQARVRPVLADAEGLVLRAYAEDGVRDLRVDFPRAATCACEALRALGDLVGHPVD